MAEESVEDLLYRLETEPPKTFIKLSEGQKETLKGFLQYRINRAYQHTYKQQTAIYNGKLRYPRVTIDSLFVPDANYIVSDRTPIRIKGIYTSLDRSPSIPKFNTNESKANKSKGLNMDFLDRTILVKDYIDNWYVGPMQSNMYRDKEAAEANIDKNYYKHQLSIAPVQIRRRGGRRTRNKRKAKKPQTRTFKKVRK
jgi:hypothetical protein